MQTPPKRMSARLKTNFIPIWKEAPFLRLLIPLIAGIILQWYLMAPLKVLAIITSLSLVLLIGFYLTRHRTNFRFGIALYFVIFLAGCWLVALKDPRNWQRHIAKHYYDREIILATLQEPLVAKPKSYKAEASVQLIDSAGNIQSVHGNIILYLSKDSTVPALDYGSTIIFSKPLIPIKNAGNPGGFDYKRYAAFKGLYYQVFLKTGDYTVSRYQNYNRFKRLLFTTRSFVINTFKKFIPGKTEAGMAEALLVGYKEDLDKSLVEQYANTGVVHIIAISGMHLGLIYVLLFTILKPLRRKRYGVILNAILIITALWFFSLLTGAAPSITRSAIMFTVIVLGNTFSRRSGIYNSLAISAFVLLLFNPFNLWDVGFQLSYAAILSIAMLARPIDGIFNPDNILLAKVWKLIAVTVAAQVFTLPLVLFHFHQFPLSFLLSNILAVPLSGIILYGLLALLLISWIPVLPVFLGWIIYFFIKFMNAYIGWVNALPFSRIGEIYFTVLQSLMLLMLIAAVCWWLLRRNTTALITASSFLFILILLIQIQFYRSAVQKKLVVYNVPQKSAIDIIEGRRYAFLGDTALQRKDFLQTFHLLPSRILYQASFRENISLNPNHVYQIQLGKYKLIILDKSLDLKNSGTASADYLLIGKNCKTKPFELLKVISCRNIIMDGTNSVYRVRQWQNAVDSLHLRLHSVQEQGAFVIDF